MTVCALCEKTCASVIDLSQYADSEVRLEAETLTLAFGSGTTTAPATVEWAHAPPEQGIEPGPPALAALAEDEGGLDFVSRPEAFPTLWERPTRGS